MLDRRKMMVGGLFAATAGLAFARKPRTIVDYLGTGKIEDVIPKQIGRWKFATTSGLVLPPEDALSESLYSQLLTRVYTDDESPPIMLLIAQSASQTGLLQVHRPEVCYPAGGFTLSPIYTEDILTPAGPVAVNQLTASREGRAEQILYWTRVGDAMPATWAQQRLTVARDNLAGRIPDAVMVRVSTVDLDVKLASANLQQFARDLLGGLTIARRRVLVA